MRKLLRRGLAALPAAVVLLGVVLMFSGVSMMEHCTHEDLYRFAGRAFLGLALVLGTLVAKSVWNEYRYYKEDV